jgi:hypothetical protein
MQAPPTPEPAEEQPQDQLTSILRNVEKLREQQPRETQQAEGQAQQQQSSAAVARQAAELASMIQQQMSYCWRIDAGAQNADDLVVEIRVQFNADGSVRGRPEVVDQRRLARDAFYRSAAENARRAIIECSPFKLPQSRYELWRDMILRFNPREMFGG